MEIPFKAGDRLPDVRLGSMGGNSRALSDFRGRKKLVYVWGSWCGCREKLGDLQSFHLAHPGLPIISIACDAQGVDLPMRYLSRAKATYEMWIDATCLLVRRWKLKRVSALVLLDEHDVVLAVGEGPDGPFLRQVENLLSKPPDPNPPPVPKVDTQDTKIEFLVQQCTNYLTRKRVDDAVGFLKQALALAPENQVLPKQIWALRHPEKFYEGPIDKEWQRLQPPLA
jgi:hypothetical protein